MTTLLKGSFAGGEISPSLAARTDLTKFQTGLALARNFFVLAHGGVSNRAGTRIVGEIKDSSKRARLLPFQFNNDQTYILEMSDEVMRVVKEGGHVLEATKAISAITQANPCVVTAVGHGYSSGDEVYLSGIGGMTQLNGRNVIATVLSVDTFSIADRNGTNINSSAYTAYTAGGTAARFYQIATAYDYADLPTLKFVQSADVMTLTHPSYQPRDLSRTGDAAWTLSTVSFVPGITQPTGVTVTPTSAGGVTYRYRVTAVDADSGEESLAGLNTTTRSISAATQANPCAITTTVNHGYSTGDTVWIDGVVGMTQLNKREFVITVTGVATFTLNDVDASAYTAWSSGGSVNRTFGITTAAATLTSSAFIDVAWTAVSGASSYNVYREKNGVYGFIGRAVGTSFRDDNITPDTSDGPPEFALPFFGTGNYPGCVTYHEERKAYGRTDNARQNIRLSRTGAYNNFSVSTPTKDDDAINVALVARQVHEIRHMISLGNLLVMTSGGEWLAKPGGSSDAITPGSLVIKPQSYRGSSDVPPIVVGNVALYVQDRGQIVRDLGYKYDVDSYTGDDLTLLSRHLFEGRTVVEWAYAQAPYSVVWCVMSDGALLSLTYLREHEVWAWCRHDTDGEFESVATTAEGDEDAVYVIVKRTIGGQTRRFIERMASRLVLDVQDSYFVDSGLSLDSPFTITGITSANPPVVTTSSAHGFTTGDVVDIADTLAANADYPADSDDRTVDHDTAGQRYSITVLSPTTFSLQDYINTSTNINGSAWTAWLSGGEVRKAVTTLTGLWHLEGKTVSILANGDVLPQQTVTNGSVTLVRAASRVHVGLPYYSDVQTLPLDVAGGNGTMQGRKKVIPYVSVRMERTRGLSGGPRESALKEMKVTLTAYNAPAGLVTDDYRLSIPGDWTTQGQLFFRQSNPLPATILGLIPEVTIAAH